MPQDQGPIGEPPIIPSSTIIVAHSRDELIKKSEGSPFSHEIAYTGLILENLMRKWTGKRDSWEQLKGKRVLDLGSGSALGRAEWHPHFARLCAVNGANVTAVDIVSQTEQDTKLFKTITADVVPVVMEGKLAKLLGDEEYDVIHSASFIGINPAPELSLRTINSDFVLEDFERKLFEQCVGLLSEGGVLYLDQSGEDYYTKKEGKLVRL